MRYNALRLLDDEGPIRLDQIVMAAGFAALAAMSFDGWQASKLPYIDAACCSVLPSRVVPEQWQSSGPVEHEGAVQDGLRVQSEHGDLPQHIPMTFSRRDIGR